MPVDFRLFWGKAHPFFNAECTMHPAAWHGLDVAACFAALFDGWPELRRTVVEAFEGEVEDLVRGLIVLVSLHDIGKFAVTFQAKVRDEFPADLGPWVTPPAARHDAIGLALSDSDRHLSPLLQALFGDSYVPGALLQAIFGHHGSPITAAPQLDLHMGGADSPASRAALRFAEAVYDLMGRPVLPALRRNAERALSWQLAGAVALADWLGSDQRHFRYEPPAIALADYWESYAKPRARAAVAQSGLLAAPVAHETIVGRLLPAGAVRSAAQAWAEEVSLEDRGLFLIEDVMGAGKTEAALILAQRLMQAGRASGLYLALPTMATANALYRRMGRLYRLLFAAAARPSLVLAHGGRDLDAAFVASLGIETAGSPGDAYGRDEPDGTASAACARWLGDDRRKAFLADVGVGTIDQALLAILPVKHACVRQIGLSRRVLIVDEAHSYDSYVQRELEALIEHQARLGGPVIILSATLPAGIRKRFVAAHARGLGRVLPPIPASLAYPLASAIGRTVEEAPLEPRPDLRRMVAIRRLATPEDAEALAVEAARAGAAVAYIRNTVDDALDSHGRLARTGLDIDLFHARFAMGDRLDIENRIVARFGRSGTPAEREGRVLVASQVVEQSIDLDFDLLITDLAPVDLVLQRMGRMWRHQRSKRGWPRPEIAVVSPEPRGEAGADWYGSVFPRAQWVYPDHALLWLSARELFARPEVRVPEDLRTMVEAAYDPAALDAAPAALQPKALEVQGRDVARRGVAALNLLNFSQGYMPASGAWGPDTATPTRLGEEQRRLRLCLWDGAQLRPWFADPDERRAWALSEVSVRASRIGGRAGLPEEIETAAARLEAAWTDRGVSALAVPLVEQSGVWSTLLDVKKSVNNATYSCASGLRW